jgi:Zn-dependent protease with chaperone function
MKIEDLIELVKNRLNNFQLSKDYARMNGNLAAMNEADKEIAAHFYIENPFKTDSGKSISQGISNLFSTHPPIAERIKILREM